MTGTREAAPIDLDVFADTSAAGERLPVPPLRLRRIHLHGVGPDGARFDPLDLDFATGDGAASRVLLSLTNTGGKSTLITLVSSLVVPAARAQVAGKNLGDYVLTGDTSHVICEWEDATTNTRTVTGTVMEWKDGRRQPGHKQRSMTNMHRAWYLFRTGPGQPGIDDLPFVIDGRRATLERYLAVLTDLTASNPQSQWVLTRIQQEWTKALEQRTSLDPVLFGYQMRMNDAEAGAEKLLTSFDSPDNVVRFFVAALNDDREISDFTSKLGPYAELAAQRPTLEALAGFGTHIAPLVERVGLRKAAVDDAAAAATRARIAGGEHAAAIVNRIAQDKQELDRLGEEAAAAARDLAAARREYGQISDIRLQLQLEQARARLADATHALTEQTQAAATAELDAKAWDAVDAILDVDVARQERDAAQTAYDAAHAGLGPLRAQVQQAAAALAGRLDALVAEADTDANTAKQRIKAGQAAQKNARDEERAAERRRDEARRLLDDIAKQIEAAATASAAAFSEGWLLAGERPDRCLRRWQTAAVTAETIAKEEDANATEAESSFDSTVAELEMLDAQLVELRRAAEQDEARLHAFDADLAAVTANETVHDLLGGPAGDVADVARAIDLAEHAASDADARAAGHERVARAAREDLAHLDETGTAPTGPDVLAVLSVLVEAGFGAVSGLDWIERNIVEPDARPVFIAALPDLAGGVVVTDPKRFAEAVERVAAAQPRTRTPVTIMTAASTTVATDAGQVDDCRYVVLPHRATWDRQWAIQVRAELAAIATSEGEAVSRARAAAARHRAAQAACAAFVSRWHATPWQDLFTAAASSSEQVSKAEQLRTTLVTARDGFREAARNARARRDQANRDGLTARQRVAAASALVATTAAAAAAADRRPGVEATLTDAQRDLAAAISAGEAAAGIIQAAMETAARARADRDVWRRARDELGVEEAAPDPGGNLAVVQAAWTMLRDELGAAEQGLVEAEFLNRAQRRLNEAIERRGRYEQAVLDRATELAVTTAASSRESLIAAQRQAHTDAGRAEKDRLYAESEHERTVARVREAAPTAGDRQNHIDLSNTPQWLPVTPADIPTLLERLETRNAELLARRDAAEAAERDAQELHDAVAADIDAFGDTIAMWPGETMPTHRVYTGSKDAARAEMRTLVAAQRDADTADRTARDELRDTVTDVHAQANGPRWRDLDAPAAVRIRSLPDADLVAEAPVLARRVRSLAESASGDLAALDTHRAILRDGLLALCREQRRLLREVTRASRLPAGLGDLSDNPTVKIRFEDAPDNEATARLAERIDSWALEVAANPKKASSADVRARWLADAVRDTVVDRARAGPWSIEVLKPRIDGKVVYCPPDRIPDEFSGGQVLTLAVLVYCALSGVRSAHRPGGARPPGTLILDNPFGTASAETLIAMQHRLAAHTGLQLVCATGLHDAGVDAAFTGPGSVIIKLRNDGDIRRNLSFLRLRARVVGGIDVAAAITAGRDPAAPQNWVDATTYEIRR